MKKKLLLVVVALAVLTSVGVAYAWFTSEDAISSNTISTGGVMITASDTAMDFTGLMPTDDPAEAKTQYIWVRNDGSEDIMLYAYVRPVGGNAALYDVVHTSITLAPDDFPTEPATLAASLGREGGPWPVYDGLIKFIVGPGQGKTFLKTETPTGVDTPLEPGQYALYKVQVWLDWNAGNEFQNQTAVCDMVFVGGQVEAWPNF